MRRRDPGAEELELARRRAAFAEDVRSALERGCIDAEQAAWLLQVAAWDGEPLDRDAYWRMADSVVPEGEGPGGTTGEARRRLLVIGAWLLAEEARLMGVVQRGNAGAEVA